METSPRALHLLVVVLGCWTLECGSTLHGCIPPWEFTWCLWISCSHVFRNYWYWSVSCRAETRKNPHCLDSSVGNLAQDIPSCCCVACVLNSCSQNWCLEMEDCSTDSTSRKRFELCSGLLPSWSRKVRCGSFLVVVTVTGVFPENVQPRTVRYRTGYLQDV